MKFPTGSALVLVMWSGSALANGGGYSRGMLSTGPFRPVNVDQVEMVSEKLDIELRRNEAVISITYQLHNPGPAVKVEMGFPCSVAQRGDLSGDGEERLSQTLPQLESFVLTADGKPVKSILTRDHAVFSSQQGEVANGDRGMSRVITGWQVVKLPFTKGQTRMVAVSYRNPWYQDVSYISQKVSRSAPMMRYLFSAAALWKGPVKSGEVTVRATEVPVEEVTLSHPKKFRREGNVWTWTFSDFEPSLQDDLEIVAGDAEFSQAQDGVGSYVMRGKTTDYQELQKTGKWFFRSRQFTATASSSLAPEQALTYGPENLASHDRNLAWAEGAPGDGIGESVVLTFKKPVRASRLYLENGYWKDQETFLNNNRIKKISVSVDDGAPFSVGLPDSMEREGIVDFPAEAGLVTKVKLTIGEVYPGLKYKDTCLTGVQVESRLSKAPQILPSR